MMMMMMTITYNDGRHSFFQLNETFFLVDLFLVRHLPKFRFVPSINYSTISSWISFAVENKKIFFNSFRLFLVAFVSLRNFFSPVDVNNINLY